MTFCPKMTEMTFLWEMTEMSMSVKLNPVCTLNTVFSRLFRCQNGSGWSRVLQTTPGGARVSPDVSRHPQVSPGTSQVFPGVGGWFQGSQAQDWPERPRTVPATQGSGRGWRRLSLLPRKLWGRPRALHPWEGLKRDISLELCLD